MPAEITQPISQQITDRIEDRAAFDRVIDRVLDHEGGYVNDPRDPGGETKFGISKRSYPGLNIKDLTLDEAQAIYFRDFWKPLNGIDPAVKFQALDFAVNSGISTAIRKLQLAIGVADDGHFGPASQAAIARMDKNDVLMRFTAERLDFLRKLTTFKDFGAGWVGRVAKNLRYAAQDN